jgi:HPt (histidine-containing phosphotransfer) domain-containing protein
MSEIDDEQDELIQEFLVECNEGLDKLDQDLLSLEEDPNNVELLSGIFRTFHTIKGTRSSGGSRADPRRRRPARHAHEPGRRARPDPQPDR